MSFPRTLNVDGVSSTISYSLDEPRGIVFSNFESEGAGKVIGLLKSTSGWPSCFSTLYCDLTSSIVVMNFFPSSFHVPLAWQRRITSVCRPFSVDGNDTSPLYIYDPDSCSLVYP